MTRTGGHIDEGDRSVISTDFRTKRTRERRVWGACARMRPGELNPRIRGSRPTLSQTPVDARARAACSLFQISNLHRVDHPARPARRVERVAAREPRASSTSSGRSGHVAPERSRHCNAARRDAMSGHREPGASRASSSSRAPLRSRSDLATVRAMKTRRRSMFLSFEL